ncbi:MAG: glutaminyl-peptide cyclotransferase [Solirubrobacteraceae bacterium]|nr:glutaminyl-peptide cyclotransferase [Solirubrobacteraceae bacterium]
MVVVVLVLLLTARDGDGATNRADPAAVVNRFDGPRAWKLLTYQVKLGPRPAGSPQLAKLASYIRARIPRGHFEPVPGHPGLRNVVGSIPGSKPAVAVAAHYDTKDLPGFVGAEDGAGGTAAVMELARALQRTKRPKGAPEIRFVFFDGEEDTDDSRPFAATGLRGSTAYAKAHHKELKALVLLDFVAEKGAMRIPYEPGSSLKIWTQLRAAADRVGVLGSFPAQQQGEVEDDHTPFVQRGVPSVDLIDFTFPCWHKSCDDLSAVSERSLDRSGEAVLELLRTWR